MRQTREEDVHQEENTDLAEEEEILKENEETYKEGDDMGRKKRT